MFVIVLMIYAHLLDLTIKNGTKNFVTLGEPEFFVPMKMKLFIKLMP